MQTKKLILGLVLAASVIHHGQAADVSTNTAVLAAECQVVKAKIQVTFFDTVPSPFQQGRLALQLNTNNIAKIPAVVSALNGGMVTLANNAPAEIAATTLNSALTAVATPTRNYASLTNSLARLNAAWEKCQ